jgi:hypothetical protein
LARTTSAETTAIVAIFLGVIVLRLRVPWDAGFCAPSATHPAVRRPVTTGTVTPARPSGMRWASCWTTDDLYVFSKMAPDCSGVRNPENPERVVADVTATGALLRR